MASERQLQDRGNSNLEDSLGIQDAQQISDRTDSSNSPTDSERQADLEHLQQVDLLTKKLKDKLNAVDTNATVD
jgi:hypothetical protein